MRIKSYYAGTVEAAMERARRELGEEAVLLHAHPAPAEARHLGVHEVVFGVEGEAPEPVAARLGAAPPPAGLPSAVPPSAVPPPAVPPLAGLPSAGLSSTTVPPPAVPANRGWADRAEFKADGRSGAGAAPALLLAPRGDGRAKNETGLVAEGSAAGRAGVEGSVAEGSVAEFSATEGSVAEGSAAFVRFLTDREFPARLAQSLARDVAREMERRLGRGPSGEGMTPRDSMLQAGHRVPRVIAELQRKGPVADALVSVLAGRLECAGEPDLAGRTYAFLGPAGSGKTTALVKLAAGWALHGQIKDQIYGQIHPEGRGASGSGEEPSPAAILSAGTLGIGAAEQLKTFAIILGASCEVVETPQALERAIAGIRKRHRRAPILIDTPGWSPAQWATTAVPWLDFFAAHPEITGHLVLPATMARREFAAAAGRFRPFGVSRLILTRIDELASGGALAGSLWEAGLPVALLGTGPSIPEDLEAASVARLVELALTDVAGPGSTEPEPEPFFGSSSFGGVTRRRQFTQGELTHV